MFRLDISDDNGEWQPYGWFETEAEAEETGRAFALLGKQWRVVRDDAMTI